jgi:hypothetical protein
MPIIKLIDQGASTQGSGQGYVAAAVMAVALSKDCRNRRAVGLLAALVLADSVPERALLHARPFAGP